MRNQTKDLLNNELFEVLNELGRLKKQPQLNRKKIAELDKKYKKLIERKSNG